MGNDADTEDANKQIHLSEKDTGISLHSDEVSSETDMLSKPYLVSYIYFIFRVKQLHLMVGACIFRCVSQQVKFDICKGDNEDDNDMAIAHVSAINEKLEDVVNKSRGSYFDFDDKTAFMEANGNPENKVCILIVDDNSNVLAKFSITGQRRLCGKQQWQQHGNS